MHISDSELLEIRKDEKERIITKIEHYRIWGVPLEMMIKALREE